MPSTAMFSNLKSRVGGGAQPHNPSDSNPISQYFEIGKVVASAGPEHIWKIHDAYRKSDGKVRSTTTSVYTPDCLLHETFATALEKYVVA